jgi:malic enzyme
MLVHFDVIEDVDGSIEFVTNIDGKDVIHTPILNKGTAFTKDERHELSLYGLIPPRVLTIDQQLEKIHSRYQELSKSLQTCTEHEDFEKEALRELELDTNIARHNFLRDLQDRNELLFYSYACRHMEEITPIIYTPTVGEAVMRFSRDSGRFRGIFLSPQNIEQVDSVFDHFRFKYPSIAVVTDNQGILGLGDQGVGGIDIPIGKLSLYVLGAGIRPWETLPITLDVGTDNADDLKDPLYLGYKEGRLAGDEYLSFIDRFIEGMKSNFPDCLVQWEDFSKQNAFTVLDNYRDKVLSFNDDIQGTGSVALAGILSALKISDQELSDQRFVIYGAGAGGIGIARQIIACLKSRYEMSDNQAREKIATLDSKGLITDEREVEDYKKLLAMRKSTYTGWEVEDSSKITMLEAIRNFQATVLIGTSGQSGHFTEEIIKAMASNTERPLIFPLSNPTSKMEVHPKVIYRLTEGKAIVATGSPILPFNFEGEMRVIGQGNNMFIFPGVGLGATLSPDNYIDDNVFTESAYTLAEHTPDDLIASGTVYPPISDIREISTHIAFTTIGQMARDPDNIDLTFESVQKKMWEPGYHRIRKK